MNKQPGPKKTRITILGAGISGLWAAYTLLKANPNLDVIVLEKQNQPGGLFNSSDRCGFHLNHGLFLFPMDSPLIRLLPHRFSPVVVSYDKYIDHRLMRFPVDPLEMKAICRISQVMPLFLNRLHRATRTVLGYTPANLDDWLRLNLPETWAEQFRINDYVYKLMGFETSELSQDVGKQRLEFIVRMLRPIHIVRHLKRRALMMLPRKKSESPPTQVHHQWLNKEGTGGFIREFSENIRAMGAQIRTGVRIQHIVARNGGYRILAEEMDPTESELVISTIPLIELAAYRTGNPVQDRHLKWRNLALFFFMLKRSMPDENPWVIYSFDRKQCWKRAVVRRMDDTFSAVRVEMTTHHTLEGKFARLMEEIRVDLSGILCVTQMENWMEWDAIEIPYGYPCLLNGYEEDMAVMKEKILGPGLYSLGRQGLHRYATSSTCARMIEVDVEHIIARHSLT